MKLSQAMNRISLLKSQLARQTNIVTGSVSRLEDETAEYLFTEELGKYEVMQKELMSLKAKVQTTNGQTFGELKDRKVSLTELIILNGELTAQLSFWQNNIMGAVTSYNYRRQKDDVKRVLSEGVSKKTVEEKISALEAEKQEVNSLIAHLNMTTNLK